MKKISLIFVFIFCIQCFVCAEESTISIKFQTQELNNDPLMKDGIITIKVTNSSNENLKNLKITVVSPIELNIADEIKISNLEVSQTKELQANYIISTHDNMQVFLTNINFKVIYNNSLNEIKEENIIAQAIINE